MLTKEKVQELLEGTGASLVMAAVQTLNENKAGHRILTMATVIDHDGGIQLLAMPYNDQRLAILKAFSEANQNMAGFSIVYDGYVSHQCAECFGHPREDCQICHGVMGPKTDAIITMSYAKWGWSRYKVTAYNYDEAGKLRLLPAVSAKYEEEASASLMLTERFAEVFGPAPTVN